MLFVQKQMKRNASDLLLGGCMSAKAQSTVVFARNARPKRIFINPHGLLVSYSALFALNDDKERIVCARLRGFYSPTMP